MKIKRTKFLAPIINPIFIGFAVIYCSLLFFKNANTPFPKIITAHLADILCLPILLSITTATMRIVTGNERTQLNFSHIFVAFLYVSLLFEAFLPYFFVKYTADPLDVVAYGVGGVVYFIMNKK